MDKQKEIKSEVCEITFERSIASAASTIFLVDCLGDSDKQSARTRQEGICDALMALSSENVMQFKSRVFHERCRHRDDWLAAMNKIRDLAKQGLNPLLFIDGHGDFERGLEMPVGGFISWAQYEVDLRAIVTAADGELTVIAAFCHSFAFVPRVWKSGAKLPFAFYYGYEDIVETRVVDMETEAIYEALLSDGGRSLDLDQLQISRYDEYDHAINVVAPIVMMRTAPKTLVQKAPEFSKAKLRSALERQLAQEGMKLGALKKAVKSALNDSALLAVRLINESMHETDRRRKFVKQILSEIKKHSRAV